MVKRKKKESAPAAASNGCAFGLAGATIQKTLVAGDNAGTCTRATASAVVVGRRRSQPARRARARPRAQSMPSSLVRPAQPLARDADTCYRSRPSARRCGGGRGGVRRRRARVSIAPTPRSQPLNECHRRRGKGSSSLTPPFATVSVLYCTYSHFAPSLPSSVGVRSPRVADDACIHSQVVGFTRNR